jgi:crotonobetainyl-CoA:carnitine CoA-transferase CaiB-like acyl-CoA transferase
MSNDVEENRGGWVKPQRTRTLPELKQLIEEKRAELAALEAQAFSLQEHARLEAIATARNIMRAHQLTIDDVVDRPGRKSAG